MLCAEEEVLLQSILILQHRSDGDAANLDLWFTVEFSEGRVNSNSPTGNYSQLVSDA